MSRARIVPPSAIRRAVRLTARPHWIPLFCTLPDLVVLHYDVRDGIMYTPSGEDVGTYDEVWRAMLRADHEASVCALRKEVDGVRVRSPSPLRQYCDQSSDTIW